MKLEQLVKVVERLNVAVGGGVKLRKHIKLHDEDCDCEYEIKYQGIIVGSELTANDYDFVLRNILEIKEDN